MAYIEHDNLDILLTMACANIAKEQEAYFNSIDTSNVEFDKRYYRKRQRIIWREKAKPAMRIIKKIASSAAIFILAILAAGFVTIMSVSSLRNAVWQIVTTWYDEYIAVHFELTDTDQDKIPETSAPDVRRESETTPSPQETTAAASGHTTPPKYIEQVYMPTWMPDGYTEVVVEKNKAVVNIEYYLEDNFLYVYTQTPIDQADYMINNVNTSQETIKLSNVEATLFTVINTGEYQLVWTNGEYLFLIYSYYPVKLETVISIAESVIPEK